MSGSLLRTAGALARICALVGVLVLTSGCGMIGGPTATTSVTPLPGEELAGPCIYDLQLTAPKVTQTGVLVIFERGDSAALFADTDVQAMTAKLSMAMVYAHQCNSVPGGDIQADGNVGPGRALFTALTQFASMTKHPELANADVVLFGFSAGGVLSITTTNAFPERVLGAIPFAAGDAQLNLANEGVTAGAARVPMLILANADDPASGTQLSYNFFKRGWAVGAPWGFAVQNGTGHCCTDSSKSLLIPWVTAIMQGQTTSSPTGQAVLKAQTVPVSPTVRFLCSPDGITDGQGSTNCHISSESVLPATSGGPDSAWLPDATTAAAWVNWVSNPATN